MELSDHIDLLTHGVEPVENPVFYAIFLEEDTTYLEHFKPDSKLLESPFLIPEQSNLHIKTQITMMPLYHNEPGDIYGNIVQLSNGVVVSEYFAQQTKQKGTPFTVKEVPVHTYCFEELE